jgi:hypothetical protein
VLIPLGSKNVIYPNRSSKIEWKLDINLKTKEFQVSETLRFTNEVIGKWGGTSRMELESPSEFGLIDFNVTFGKYENTIVYGIYLLENDKEKGSTLTICKPQYKFFLNIYSQ